MADDAEPISIRGLAELEMTLGGPAAYVRYSKGPQHDLGEASVDTESGLELPGLSVNPLDPEPWWTRPTAEAERRYRERFDVGRGPEGPEG